MEKLIGADRRVRVLMTCAATLLAANVMVVGARLSAEPARDPDAVIIGSGTSGTVLITSADGKTVSVDPSSPEGKAAIAAAEERGDTIVTAPSGGPDAIAATGDDAPSADELDAADGVLDGIVETVDEATGEVVQRTVEQVEDALETAKATTTSTPGDGGDEPLVSVTTPGVTITTPEVTVTTPAVTVTTPPVTVTTPPVTVATPVTTVTVPTTTVTVPTTTVTIPPVTVTVPTTTVTVPTTTVTIPPVTVTVTTLVGL